MAERRGRDSLRPRAGATERSLLGRNRTQIIEGFHVAAAVCAFHSDGKHCTFFFLFQYDSQDFWVEISYYENSLRFVALSDK